MENYPILQSIIEALGATLLHSLWQGFIIAFILIIIIKINNNKSPQFKYHLSCASLFGMVIWMSSTFFSYFNFNYSNEKTGIISNNIPLDIIIIPSHSAVINWQENLDIYFSSFIDLYADKLVFIWMLGVVLFGLKWTGALYYTQSLKRKHIRPVSLKWQHKIKKLSSDMRINKHINILESAKVDVPLVIGYLKPVILIPSSAFTGFTPAQLESVIVHELAHIKNNDFLMNMILSALEVILFYHPAYWYINRIIMQERENRCDDMAVAHLGNPRLYAETLFNMEKIRQQHSLGMSFQGNKNQLLERIKRICVAPNSNYKGGINPTGITLGLLFILAIISLARVPMDAKESIIKPLKEEVKEMLDLSIKNDLTDNKTVEIPVENNFLYHTEEEVLISELNKEENILKRSNNIISKINISPLNNLLEKENNPIFPLVGITLKKEEKKDTIPTPKNTETTIKCNVDNAGNTTLNYFNNKGENYRRIVIKKGKAKMKLNGIKTPFENKDYFIKKGDNLSLKGTMRIYDLEKDKGNSTLLKNGDLNINNKDIISLKADEIIYNEDGDRPLYERENKNILATGGEDSVDGNEYLFWFKEEDKIISILKTNDRDIVVENRTKNGDVISVEGFENERELKEEYKNLLKLHSRERERQKEYATTHQKDIIKQQKEIEKQQKEVERMHVEIEVEHKERMKEHEHRMKEHEKRMDHHQNEMEEREENHKRLEKENKAREKEMDRFQSDLVHMLKADGLIKRKDKFKFSLTSEKLKVDGKIQPSNIHQKYLKWYEKSTGKKMGKNSKHTIEVS